ncbi:MAG: hypothetical protein U0T77_06895 [Chitinophagales bacterium]
MLNWQKQEQVVAFNGAVFPPVFSGLPVYSTVVDLGAANQADVKMKNAVYQSFKGSSLSPNQIKTNRQSINSCLRSGFLSEKQHGYCYHFSF